MINKEEFCFDSRDGVHKIYAVKWVPDSEKPVCIVQIVHGMAEHINRYEAFATGFGKTKTGYRTKVVHLNELAGWNLARKKKMGIVIQELIISKLALMTFSV